MKQAQGLIRLDPRVPDHPLHALHVRRNQPAEFLRRHGFHGNPIVGQCRTNSGSRAGLENSSSSCFSECRNALPMSLMGQSRRFDDV
jgi:hypothetical protein